MKSVLSQLQSTSLTSLILIAVIMSSSAALESADESEIQFNGEYIALQTGKTTSSLVSRLHVTKEQDPTSGEVSYLFGVVLFEQNNIFSRGIFINSVLKYNQANKQLAPTGPSKIYEEQVGIQA